MIAINLIVPSDDRFLIKEKESDTFRIISIAHPRNKTTVLYVVETTEEDYSFLKLKYGNMVWKR